MGPVESFFEAGLDRGGGRGVVGSSMFQIILQCMDDVCRAFIRARAGARAIGGG